MKALELADAYADACFDQALNGRTEDPIPEQKRDELAAELRRLAAVEAELERIKALPPVAWRSRVKGLHSWWVELQEPPERPNQETQPLIALGSKT